MLKRRRRRAPLPCAFRILNEEEWTRINEHLAASERGRNEEARPNEGAEKMRMSSLLTNGSIASSKDVKCVRNAERSTAINGRQSEPGKGRLRLERQHEQIICRAKKILFENKEYTRRLISALGLSTILHERSKQTEFNRKLRREMEAREEESRLRLREEADRARREATADKMREKEKMETFRRELDKQMLEKAMGRRASELEKEMEKDIMLRMSRDARSAAEEDRERERKRRDALRRDIREFTESVDRFRRKLKTEMTERDEINDIYQAVAFKIDKMRRGKEESLRVGARASAGHGVAPLAAAEVDGGRAAFPRFASEKKPPAPVPEDGTAFQRELEQRRIADGSERKLSLVRRLRKDEADKLRCRKEAEEANRKQMETRRHYDRQLKEKEEELRREKLLDRSYAVDFTQENLLIDACCSEILELAKRHNRPIHPITAAIKEIRRQYGLRNVTDETFLRSNIVLGSCR